MGRVRRAAAKTNGDLAKFFKVGAGVSRRAARLPIPESRRKNFSIFFRGDIEAGNPSHYLTAVSTRRR